MHENGSAIRSLLQQKATCPTTVTTQNENEDNQLETSNHRMRHGSGGCGNGTDLHEPL